MAKQLILNVKIRRTYILIMAISAVPLASHAKEMGAVILDYISMFEASVKKPMPSCYPQLADRMRGIFSGHGATTVRTWGVVNGVRKEGATIYIEGTEAEIVAPEGDWNLSTDDNYVYEWVTGSNSGVRIKRVNEDLVALLYYDTDPSWIMASLYFDFLRAPKSFHVVPSPDPNVDEIVFNKPIEGFEAVYASHDPLWFYGFRANGNEFRFSKPQEEKEIPKTICGRRLRISFHDSGETLARRMTFL